MSYKYNKPEWRKTPMRAQIDEALREVEQVKLTLLALRGKAAKIDEYHNMRVGYMRQRTDKNTPEREKAWNAQVKMGEWAGSDAASELLRLDGWMKSLTESELGLNVMLSPSFTTGGIRFEVNRTNFIKQRRDFWMTQMSLMLFSPP